MSPASRTCYLGEGEVPANQISNPRSDEIPFLGGILVVNCMRMHI